MKINSHKPYSFFTIIWVVVFFCLSSLFLFGQSKHDSLLSVFTSTKDPLNKGLVLEKLFVATMFSDYDTSRYYIDQVIAIGRDNGLDTLVKIGFNRLSTHFLVTSNYAASDSMSRLLEPMISPNDHSELAQQHHMNRGNYYYLTGQHVQASKQFIRVKEICELNDNQVGVASVSSGIGNCFKKIGDNDKALEHYLFGYNYFKSISDTIPKLIALCTNIGEVYIKSGNRKLGKKYILEGLTIAEKNSHFLNICLSSNNMAIFHIEESEFAYAKKYLDKSIKLSKEKKLWREHIASLKAYGRLYLDQNNYDRSIHYLKQAISLSQEKNIKTDIGSIYNNLYEAYEGRQEFDKAIDYLKKNVALRDSLSGVEKAKEIQELNLKYETVKKDAEINAKDLEITKSNTARQRLTFGLGLLGLLASGTFIFMRNKIATNKKITSKDKLIQSQKISQLEKEKKLLAMNAMLEGQEAERMRIAKDLHDGLGGLLSTVKARLTNINTEVKKIESYNIYQKTTSMVDEACDEVRRISHNLLPGALRLDGLKTAVLQLGEELDEAHSFNVKVEVIGFEDRLDETQQIFLYRIIQESTNNIIKYADAQEVLIQLSESVDKYHLIIEDNGKGFSTNMRSKGLGLKSIQSRVEHLNGELDISSKTGEGTTITAHIPKIEIKSKGDES